MRQFVEGRKSEKNIASNVIIPEKQNTDKI